MAVSGKAQQSKRSLTTEGIENKKGKGKAKMDVQRWFGSTNGLIVGIICVALGLVLVGVMVFVPSVQQQVLVTPTPKTEMTPEGVIVSLTRQDEDRKPAGLVEPIYATGVKDAGFLNMHVTVLWISVVVVILTILEAKSKEDPADALCLLVPVLVLLTTWIRLDYAWSLALLVASIAGVLALAASGQGGLFDYSAPSSALFLAGIIPIVRGSLGFVGSVLNVKTTAWFSLKFTWLLLLNDETQLAMLSCVGYVLIILGILLRILEVSRERGGQNMIVSLACIAAAVFLYKEYRLSWLVSMVIGTGGAVLISTFLVREGDEEGKNILEAALQRLQRRSWPSDIGALTAQVLALLIIA